jgi:hypothetical protein
MNTENDTPKWHLHINPAEKYLKQLCSEGKVLQKGKRSGKSTEVWKPLSLHTPNHFWDAEIYALAAAEMLGVYAFREEDRPKPIKEVNQVEREKAGQWITKKRNWIKRG